MPLFKTSTLNITETQPSATAAMAGHVDSVQFDTFRDCLSSAIVERITRPPSKPKKRSKKGTAAQPPSATPTVTVTTGQQQQDTEEATSAEDLADFIDYLAAETFESFPEDLRSLTHLDFSASPALQEKYALPLTGSDVARLLPSLAPSIGESLTAYGIVDGLAQGAPELLAPVLTEYVAATTAAPPPPRATKADADGCELCGRDWIPLTYHHLIPRFVHDKAVRRGWHRAEDLERVAWLCRLCHSFVHRFAGHEELARRYYTVEMLLEEEEVVRFARYASRVRWKGR